MMWLGFNNLCTNYGAGHAQDEDDGSEEDEIFLHLFAESGFFFIFLISFLVFILDIFFIFTNQLGILINYNSQLVLLKIK